MKISTHTSVVFINQRGLLNIHGLFNKSTILEVQQAIPVAFNIRIVSDHDTGGLLIEIDL